MKLKTVKIKDLTPHERNPNRHPAEQITELEGSLDQFDQVKNIVVWQNQVIAGNGLLMAAKKQGRDAIEVQDVSDWPEEKAIKYMISDNRLSELAIMDDNLLVDLLADFDEPLDIPGIDENFLNNIDLSNNELPEKLNEDIGESYQILIECESETQQQSLLQKFLEEKLKCRALIS